LSCDEIRQQRCASPSNVPISAKPLLKPRSISSALSRRGKTFPEVGESAEAAAYVWSRAPKIVDAFDRGVVIRSARGLFLAIPTAAAGKSGRSAVGSREKITPEGWQRRTGLKLRFVCRRGRPSLLVADDARTTKRGLAAKVSHIVSLKGTMDHAYRTELASTPATIPPHGS
jgi:hypothetical protein